MRNAGARLPVPLVKPTTSQNHTLAEIEKGPTFHTYGSGCGPSRPHTAKRPCPGLGIGGRRGPLQLQL
eukprot:1493408-Alexandrium_andersonii.AAC.1